VAEIGIGNERRGCAVRNLRVGVVCTHQAINVPHEDWFDLKRAKLAVSASGMIVSAGFDLDKRG